jgi:glucokinase
MADWRRTAPTSAQDERRGADERTLVDLDMVAIGGGFSRVSADYIDLVQQALTASAAHEYSRRTRVVRSGLGDEGPLIGAAALVLR